MILLWNETGVLYYEQNEHLPLWAELQGLNWLPLLVF